ncbi:MAG: hypothetical protein QME85_06060 [Candidatus Saccharicenans sp.]|nr:hypothetical protein [Candidatus Saccharicenans sp.]
MPYFVAKTGLEIFDLCRAYGLAALLDRASPEENIPVIYEAGSFYKVEHPSDGLNKNYLINNTGWYQLFVNEPGVGVWNSLFLTDKNNWPKKVERVKKILSDNFDKIISEFQNPSFLPKISSNKGETLSGPLDPSAFKGLRGKTRGDYCEAQTKVDSQNWALAYLGGAIAGRYKIQKAQGNKWNYFVMFPVPERIEFNNFRDIKEKTYTIGLKYISVQNAAAHFSVCLAQKMRELTSSRSQFSDRFSGVFYFSMIQSGQQFKPFSGGNLSLHSLMELAYSGNPDVEKVFEVWNYLFRKGSVQGCEDLGVAITDFIMHPTLETYEKHARLFLRYMIRGEVKSKNFYTEEILREVINYVH